MAAVVASALCVSAGVAWGGGVGQAGSAASSAPAIATFGGEKAVARPSRDAVMGFSFPSQIDEVLVRGGERVKAGDMLVRAKDADIVAATELAKVQAESEHEVARAKAAYDLAKLEFDNFEKAMSGGSANQQEFDRARNAMETRKIEWDLSRVILDTRQVQYRQRLAELDRYRLKAPFDGKVDQVVAEVGQALRETDPAVRVVAVDPLWIDVPTPIEQTIVLGLKVDAPAWVVMDLPGERRVYPARVVEVAAVADSASQTRRVRVELRNPEEWPAGLTAWVRFSEPAGAWKERIVGDWPMTRDRAAGAQAAEGAR